jgi:hypothetical protein
MLELVIKLWTPSSTCELIECLSKVLDGTPVACGSKIGRRPNVMFRVSCSTATMSLVLNLKIKQQCIHKLLHHFMYLKLALHKLISGKNCVFSWCTCILGTREFDALTTCGVVVSSSLANKGAFFFYVERTKRLWHDCSSFSSPGNRTWTICESISLNYLTSGRNFGCHSNFLCCEIGRAKRSGKFWCVTRIVCIRKNIFPNHGIVWEVVEWPKRSLSWSWRLYKLGMTSWLGKLAFQISKLGP